MEVLRPRIETIWRNNGEDVQKKTRQVGQKRNGFFIGPGREPDCFVPPCRPGPAPFSRKREHPFLLEAYSPICTRPPW